MKTRIQISKYQLELKNSSWKLKVKKTKIKSTNLKIKTCV